MRLAMNSSTWKQVHVWMLSAAAGRTLGLLMDTYSFTIDNIEKFMFGNANDLAGFAIIMRHPESWNTIPRCGTYSKNSLLPLLRCCCS